MATPRSYMVSTEEARRYPVALAIDMPPGTRRLISIPGLGSVGVFNIGGEFYAVKNVCPHQGGPLCEGTLTGTSRPIFALDEAPQLEWVHDGEILRCPWHGWEFSVRTGAVVFDGKARVATYGVEVVAGLRAATTFPVAVEDKVVILVVPSAARYRTAK
ncbi:MAG: Rieske (2Fe-2S) protein [Fimbriimonadales bacterium]